MTGPTVAPSSRELVVPRALLLALGAVAGGKAPEDAVGELSARGLLDPSGRPLEEVAPTADAVGAPLATVRVTAMRPEGPGGADLWIGRSRVVLHPAGDGPAPVVSVSRSLLPQLVVRTTGLGPRPVLDGPAFDAEVADIAAACAGNAPPPWPGEAQRPRLWRVTWQAGGDDDSGDVAVLDLGPQGLWRPAAAAGPALSWSPVSAATVWRELGRLFAVTLDDRLEP